VNKKGKDGAKKNKPRGGDIVTAHFHKVFPAAPGKLWGVVHITGGGLGGGGGGTMVTKKSQMLATTKEKTQKPKQRHRNGGFSCFFACCLVAAGKNQMRAKKKSPWGDFIDIKAKRGDKAALKPWGLASLGNNCEMTRKQRFRWNSIAVRKNRIKKGGGLMGFVPTLEQKWSKGKIVSLTNQAGAREFVSNIAFSEPT